MGLTAAEAQPWRKKRIGFAVLTSLVAACAFAQVTTDPASAPATPAAEPAASTSAAAALPAPAAGQAPAAAPPSSPAKMPAVSPKPTSPAVPVVRPLWKELTPQQQSALAPLSGEWDELDSFRKNKWLGIAAHFSKMKPEEQQRMQERMRDWVKLTPQQRRAARESFARSKSLPPDLKSEQWKQYQQLPDEQKKKLAADASAKAKTPVATLPPASSKPTTVPPIKSTPKPVLEQSVTPKATNQSDIRPSPPSEKK